MRFLACSTSNGDPARVGDLPPLSLLARAALPPADCVRWLTGIHAAKTVWTPAFNREQFTLGRAFYTHLEEEQTADYFASALSSDSQVEHFAPGLQSAMRALLAEAVSGRVTPRSGWCGAGVHIFPARGKVAARGGVVHFDTEGLAAEHVTHRRRAVSLVLMLQPGMVGGATRLWPILYDGRDELPEAEWSALQRTDVACAAGDGLLFDSYRLHQIAPFGGGRDRISATLHGAEIDPGTWESWF